MKLLDESFIYLLRVQDDDEMVLKAGVLYDFGPLAVGEAERIVGTDPKVATDCHIQTKKQRREVDEGKEEETSSLRVSVQNSSHR